MDPRIRSAILLDAFTVLGIFLLVAPWTPVWAQAVGALLQPPYVDWARSGWLRGIVSGLGALDLMVALQMLGDVWRHLGVFEE